MTGREAARRRRLILRLVLLGAAMTARPADALYLDGERNFDLRARLYTEGAVAAEHSESQTKPVRTNFQLISHRTFFNPEFDGNLTSYQPFGLDALKFRLTLWGFYDGIYDYGTGQYDRSRQAIKARLTEGVSNTAPITRTDNVRDTRKVYTYQGDPVLGHTNDEGTPPDLPFRINEAYFDFTKGPLWIRAGRQTVSWGESDTIALLDQQNPFNLTLASPGIFQDIDEARIPLWTLRTTYELVDNWKWLSNLFVDAYLVPGSIDTTVSQLPIPEASPYSPAETDPQNFIDAFTAFIPEDVREILIKGALGGIQFVQYDHLPSRKMSNSRYGVRLSGLLAREYTTQIWFYRTFANNPVPRFLPFDLSRVPTLVPTPGVKKGPSQLITETVHEMNFVAGGAVTFFSQPLDGIVRFELEYFLNEQAFIPSQNIPFEALVREPRLREFLGQAGVDIPPGIDHGVVPDADYLRFELGYDRFFFYRPLNPTNSFVFVAALIGQWNLSETFTGDDYRLWGQRKPSDDGLMVGANVDDLGGIEDVGKLQTVSNDFVDMHPMEGFVQGTLQTEYMHGRLQPRFTAIVGLRGSLAFPMHLVYRYSDNMIFDFSYVNLAGTFTFPTGLFRDRDQLKARVTFLLN